MIPATSSIVITGAAGFIGSYFVGYLNRLGYERLILVDDFAARPDKAANLEGKRLLQKIDRAAFFAWWDAHPQAVDSCFHLGARTDTTEMDEAIHTRLNLEYSKEVFARCATNAVPLVYASSAATYGNGEHGYDDDETKLDLLQPLNPYGWSKHRFDQWALAQQYQPPFFAGVKFFNVYGPNEFHKGRMASVILHAFRQIKETGGMTLFRSHHPDYTDGGQMRDFVYVADVADMIFWLMNAQPASGIYNIGSGKARPFLDLANATFAALGLPPRISFVDTPADIRDKYQYFTEASMDKLFAAGYTQPPHSLEQGIADYVSNYLQGGRYF